MRSLVRATVLAGAPVVGLAGCFQDPVNAEQGVLRLAVTTSTMDSGLMERLLPAFEEQERCRVDVIAVPTGTALKLGEAGDVDAVLVHDRDAELAFLAAGHATRHEGVMFNHFQIVGPADDPAGIAGLAPAEALTRIERAAAPFVSRGDDSGTHRRELELWRRSTDGHRVPRWSGYVECGQGMGPTLVMADQRQAYTLCDRGTWLKMRDRLELVELLTTGDELRNDYGLLVVSGSKGDWMRTDLAQSFADYLCSAEVQRKIGDYRIGGEALFNPVEDAPGR